LGPCALTLGLTSFGVSTSIRFTLLVALLLQRLELLES
jgi:hypothetical protein